MQAFLGISLWIALATVCPGLVTLAVVYVAVLLVRPDALPGLVIEREQMSEWSSAGLALTLMILTQAFGILLERVLVRNRWLGGERERVEIPDGIDPVGERRFELEPYAEYQGVYLLLAELSPEDDAQGHLQRAVAQFFLTNNTLVSFAVGIVVTLSLLAGGAAGAASAPGVGGYAYLLALAAALVVSHRVAVIRFGVMARALWAARRRRIAAGRAGRGRGARDRRGVTVVEPVRPVAPAQMRPAQGTGD